MSESTSLCSEHKFPEPIIRLDGIIIRSHSEKDAESMAKYANNSKIAMWMRNTFPHPYTIESSQSWISSQTPTSTDYVICRAEDNVVIGSIGLKPRTDVEYRTMEIGYWLGEEFWGQGIVTGVVAAFTKWTFETFDHILRIQAEVFEGNEPSGRVLQKAGYAFEGRRRRAVEKAGVVKDVLIYCRFRDDI
ncbi:acetyltransferase [Penicillium longicatenatum]|uniref:acetyltransferase n=1 Tax=Penicillium longicatenatum TaxID=1561947 RepID=UPI002548E860|nr:acetyltransferase [Penicillium longicatenatum]KAJ5650468.1 acetyltransferase [Penicillium longicatenatum]